jgi:hypothetical protein
MASLHDLLSSPYYFPAVFLPAHGSALLSSAQTRFCFSCLAISLPMPASRSFPRPESSFLQAFLRGRLGPVRRWRRCDKLSQRVERKRRFPGLFLRSADYHGSFHPGCEIVGRGRGTRRKKERLSAQACRWGNAVKVVRSANPRRARKCSGRLTRWIKSASRCVADPLQGRSDTPG